MYSPYLVHTHNLLNHCDKTPRLQCCYESFHTLDRAIKVIEFWREKVYSKKDVVFCYVVDNDTKDIVYYENRLSPLGGGVESDYDVIKHRKEDVK